MNHTTPSPLALNTLCSLTVGLDIGDRVTHLCVLNERREVLARGKFDTNREKFAENMGNWPPSKVVLEAGSQSLWVSHFLRGLGHNVLVVDPRRVHHLVKGKTKTDRRDAETLARLGQGVPELLGEAHHRTLEIQAELTMVRSRDTLVRARTMTICSVRGLVKAFGIKLPTSSASNFHAKAMDKIPSNLQPALMPLLNALGDLDRRLDEVEAALTKLAKTKPEVAALRQVNGVGPIVAMAFVLTVGDPTRFKHSRDVGPWVGLTPRIFASGSSDPQLPIVRCGDGYLRRLLVVAAHHILGPFGKDSDLRRYGLRICERGGKNGKKRAVCAVARKLAVLLHRLWVSGAKYEPLRNSAKKGTT